MAKNKILQVVQIEHQHPVTLSQQGTNRFTVTYGAEVRDRLDYSRAAAEFGNCVMHALACNGVLETD
jgi:hypothetical protein